MSHSTADPLSLHFTLHGISDDEADCLTRALRIMNRRCATHQTSHSVHMDQNRNHLWKYNVYFHTKASDNNTIDSDLLPPLERDDTTEYSTLKT